MYSNTTYKEINITVISFDNDGQIELMFSEQILKFNQKGQNVSFLNDFKNDVIHLDYRCQLDQYTDGI